jgi:predicted nucleotidyltransferase
MHIAPAQFSRIADICRRYHVRSLQLFGSAAVGAERADSDVDLLVEFIPGEAPSGFGLVDMQDELSAAFNGRKIDLAFPSVLTFDRLAYLMGLTPPTESTACR